MKPNAEEYYNPSREYLSRLINTLKEKRYSMTEISRRIGVSRGTVYNHLRDESDPRYRPHPYTLQFALEKLLGEDKSNI
ncbi:ArsR family transcriptional regulator [Pasteurella multocida]|uniref:ArsR family transcriptional regulator n=1 Tax=Pasteurella multocida TaxID=747 RepID=UPI0023017FB5|nr:ArsR family transcriptional regulator [Pasteurella multocida]MDA5609128.1 helix-turn-helix transcriptional regulator [Pasteurella multocida subsp. multocida]MDA5616627.1 helix-turn-helix transcriptional regulator [Pasteurella multocida]MDA5626668.1 helix-turn-helix transcriptional regulator [Pasteurella multocida]